METKGKFILMTLQEIEGYLYSLDISHLRKIDHIQTHHTWSPSYRNFGPNSHFAKMESMEADHIARGFGQIAQHFTTFPDGQIVIGRDLNLIPTCIHGHNTGGICIENLGNFDKGQDVMDTRQATTIVQLNALLCFKFSFQVNINTIVYHHWFRQSDGFRDNGENDPKYLNHKTCPGTGFFGGNKVSDAQLNYLPLIEDALKGYKTATTFGPTIKKGVVNTDLLNVRSGPGTDFPVVAHLKRNMPVMIIETNNEWDRIGDNIWVNADYIALSI